LVHLVGSDSRYVGLCVIRCEDGERVIDKNALLE
jgi:hypothetical protein